MFSQILDVELLILYSIVNWVEKKCLINIDCKIKLIKEKFLFNNINVFLILQILYKNIL